MTTTFTYTMGCCTRSRCMVTSAVFVFIAAALAASIKPLITVVIGDVLDGMFNLDETTRGNFTLVRKQRRSDQLVCVGEVRTSPIHPSTDPSTPCPR